MTSITNEKKEPLRNSSIELLRIISMLMIVLHHFASYGEFSFDNTTLSIPRFWWNIMEMGGKLGVDVFVLISGYFLVKSKGGFFNIKRILKFWGQIIFYSISIYLIFGILGISEWSIMSLVKTCFPITFSAWWFASTYFVLYIIHPFLNILLQKLDKSTYQKLLVTVLILWCIIPTFTTSSYQGNSLLWFIALYCVAGYVRLFGLNNLFIKKHYLGLWFLFSLLRYLSCVALVLLGTRIPFASSHSLYFYNQNSIFTFLSALALFMYFEKTNIGYHKWINVIASATFGVYLIHDSKIIRPLLWLDVFKNAQYQESIMLIPYSIIVVLVVYAACTIIDLVRQRLFEKPFIIMVDKYSQSWLKPFEKICDVCKAIVFGKEK